jgi:undecaprenyl-diphosphatase
MAIGVGGAALTTRFWPTIDAAPETTPGMTSKTEAAPSGTGLVLIANTASGADTNDEYLTAIRSRLPDCVVLEVQDPSTIPEVATQAASEASALGVLSGDGTIGAVAAVAIEHNLPLAVFPGGTLNHFARDLGVGDITKTCDAVSRGELVAVDAATIAGRTFVNTASFGSYAEFVNIRERYEKFVGKWPGAIVAMAALLRKNETVEVRIDGERRSVLMIFIGNCCYEPVGFAPLARNRMDDGRLDCRYLEAQRPAPALRVVAALVTGRLDRSRSYTRFTTDRLAIESDPDLPLAADGETFMGDGSFEVQKHDRPLRVFKAR